MPISFLQDRFLHPLRGAWRVQALKDITFAVEKGEWVGLYGPNGCGKTTLLRILAGLMQPDSGSVDVRGTISSYFDFSAGFHDERSAVENLYFHGLFRGMSSQEIRSIIDDIIAFAGVESHQDLPVKCFSTGMKLRLGFAAATHMKADVYLMDEVLAVGDRAFQIQCLEKLTAMKATGASALLVSHNLQHLKRVCDRVLYLEEGALTHEECVHAVAH